MRGLKVTRAEAEQQVTRLVDALEAARWQLLGIALCLPEEEGDETGGEAEARRVLECVLADRILPALEDLRSVLSRS